MTGNRPEGCWVREVFLKAQSISLPSSFGGGTIVTFVTAVEKGKKPSLGPLHRNSGEKQKSNVVSCMRAYEGRNRPTSTKLRELIAGFLY